MAFSLCGHMVRQRIESVRRGVVVSTRFCGFSRCVGAWSGGKLGV